MLNPDIENLLNSFGSEGMTKVIDMAQVEIFRNYCIHNFDWFKGGIKAHCDQHRYEKTWMRYYVDNGRLPTTISFHDILDKKLSRKDVGNALQDIYLAYIEQHDFDIMNPDYQRKQSLMKLENF